MLAAATNPDQLAYADDWLAQNRNLTGSALAQAVDQQSWDPSIKALTQFPSVMDNLAHNLSWTSSLGQAFANQQSDVMAAVQAMRAKAQAAGTLQSNSQITVTQPTSQHDRDSTGEPAGRLRSAVQPGRGIWRARRSAVLRAPPLPVASFGLYFGTGITIGASFGGGWWWWSRLGLACLGCELGLLRRRWFDRSSTTTTPISTTDLEQHELQRLSSRH